MGRAFKALLLLIGFYGMGFGLLGLLVVLNILLNSLGLPDSVESKAFIASVLLCIPVVRGIFFTRGNRMRKPPGLAVTPRQQPLLWQRVRFLAAQMGTRPPREIRLTPDVNAFVHENTRMAGLLPGKRRLFIGVPLLIGLTPAELDAVLCHELGHYSNKDTRMAGLVQRGRASMLSTVRLYAGKRTGNATLYRVYRGYAEYFLRTTEAISRQQESAADLAAARIAGRANTADALRQLPALQAGFGFYMENYATAGLPAGLRPTEAEFLAGFRHLMADPKRAAELEEIRREPPEEKPTPYDSHPPLRERIAALEALPPDGKGRDGGSALAILYAPDLLFAAVTRTALKKEVAALPQADWAPLFHAAARARVLQAATPLLDATRETVPGAVGLVGVLYAVDAGRLDEIASRLPEPNQAKGTTGRVRAQHMRTAFSRRLLALVQFDLAERGCGSWPFSWSHAPAFTSPDIAAPRLDAAVGAVVALTPDTAPLRALLFLPASGVPGRDMPATGLPGSLSQPM